MPELVTPSVGSPTRERVAYSAFGLRIHSEFPLPELGAAPPGGPPDVVIRSGAVEAPDGPCPEGRLFRAEGEEAYLYWEPIGPFVVRGGREIVVGSGTSDARLRRMALLGVCAGVLLHQRGRLTLHASAVVCGSAAVAFVGWKGAGKSTLAAAMTRAGHPLVTDDVLVVDEVGEQHVATPAFSQLKLRPDAAEAAGSAADGASTPTGKVLLGESLPFQAEAVPLRAIYVLGSGDTTTAERVDPAEAFPLLLSQTYAPRFVGGADQDAGLFEKVVGLARGVPVYSLRRPRDLEALPETVRFLEEHGAS